MSIKSHVLGLNNIGERPMESAKNFFIRGKIYLKGGIYLGNEILNNFRTELTDEEVRDAIGNGAELASEIIIQREDQEKIK